MMKSLVFVLLEKLHKQKLTCKLIHFKEKLPLQLSKRAITQLTFVQSQQ